MNLDDAPNHEASCVGEGSNVLTDVNAVKLRRRGEGRRQLLWKGRVSLLVLLLSEHSLLVLLLVSALKITRLLRVTVAVALVSVVVALLVSIPLVIIAVTATSSAATILVKGLLITVSGAVNNVRSEEGLSGRGHSIASLALTSLLRVEVASSAARIVVMIMSTAAVVMFVAASSSATSPSAVRIILSIISAFCGLIDGKRSRHIFDKLC